MRSLTAEDVWHLHALPALSGPPSSGSGSDADLNRVSDPQTAPISGREAHHLAACLALPLASGLLKPCLPRPPPPPLSGHCLAGGPLSEMPDRPLRDSPQARRQDGLIQELLRSGVGIATTSGRVTLRSTPAEGPSLSSSRDREDSLPHRARHREQEEPSTPTRLVLFPPSLGNAVDFGHLFGTPFDGNETGPPTAAIPKAAGLSPDPDLLRRLGWSLVSDSYLAVGRAAGIPVGHWRWLLGLLGGVADLPRPVKTLLRGVPSAASALTATGDGAEGGPPPPPSSSSSSSAAAFPLWPLPLLHPPLPSNADADADADAPPDGSWTVEDWDCPGLDRILRLMLGADDGAMGADGAPNAAADGPGGGAAAAEVEEAEKDVVLAVGIRSKTAVGMSRKARRKALALRASVEAQDALKSLGDRMRYLAGLLAERWEEYGPATRAKATPSGQTASGGGIVEGPKDLPSTFCLMLRHYAWLPNCKGR